jgi:hypothetical protein
MENPKINKNKIKKEFNLDSEKLDLNIVKTEEGTSVNVTSKDGLVKTVGILIVKAIIKKFSK